MFQPFQTTCQISNSSKVHESFTILQDLKAGTELFTKYDVAFDKQGMKNVLKKALDLGHMVSGKSKSQFVKDVKPYLKAASKMAEKIELEDIISFGTK